MRHAFTLEYWQDEGWYVGRLKEVPGVFSQGETLVQLEENIRDAYDLVLADSTPAPSPAGAESNGRKAPVPRHAEIKDSLCRLIRLQLGLAE
jgi:predicted RNase H-like HicB family nuclease